MRILPLLLLGMLLTATARAEDAKTAVPSLSFQHRILSNGLNLYTVEDHGSPTVAIQVWYHVGAKDDPPGRSGFAHLFEHMMFKGTRDMKPEMLDRLTEDVGGINNAYTADDVTVFYETVPSNYLESLVWAEAERMSSLNVDIANFNSERSVVEEEFRQRVLADPYGEFGLELDKKSFVKHPYKRPPIGNMADLDAANLKDVRAFHSTFYRPDNATMVVVGDFDPAEMNHWIDKYLGGISKPAEPIPRVKITEPFRTREQRFSRIDPKVPLPALAITYFAPARSGTDAPVFQVLEELLGGGDSSRLYKSLVYEKQLVQSVSCNADLREDIGLLEFSLVVAGGKSPGEVEQQLLLEIAKLRDEPVSQAELTKARNRILTEKLKERETFEGRAAALADAAVLLGDASGVNTELDKIQAVTAEDVKRVMRKYILNSNRVVISYLPKPATASKDGSHK